MITAQEAYTNVIERREARESKFREILNFVVSTVCNNELENLIKIAIQEDVTHASIAVDKLKQLVVPYGENEFFGDWEIHGARVTINVVDEIRKLLEKFGYEVELTGENDVLEILFDNPQGVSRI